MSSIPRETLVNLQAAFEDATTIRNSVNWKIYDGKTARSQLLGEHYGEDKQASWNRLIRLIEINYPHYANFFIRIVNGQKDNYGIPIPLFGGKVKNSATPSIYDTMGYGAAPASSPNSFGNMNYSTANNSGFPSGSGDMMAFMQFWQKAEEEKNKLQMELMRKDFEIRDARNEVRQLNLLVETEPQSNTARMIKDHLDALGPILPTLVTAMVTKLMGNNAPIANNVTHNTAPTNAADYELMRQKSDLYDKAMAQQEALMRQQASTDTKREGHRPPTTEEQLIARQRAAQGQEQFSVTDSTGAIEEEPTEDIEDWAGAVYGATAIQCLADAGETDPVQSFINGVKIIKGIYNTPDYAMLQGKIAPYLTNIESNLLDNSERDSLDSNYRYYGQIGIKELRKQDIPNPEYLVLALAQAFSDNRDDPMFMTGYNFMVEKYK